MQDNEQHDKIYQYWSESEINRLIDAVDASFNSKSNKTDWQNVIQLFPDRTLQQCKSFYCNQIKPYIFKPGQDLNKDNIKFTLMCYYYYITEKMPGDYETLDLRVQRILADQCWTDMISSYVKSVNYQSFSPYQLECSIKLMRGTRYMITYHFKNEKEITEQLKKTGKITRMGFVITTENWRNFLKKFEANKLGDILKKVKITLKTMNI
ncbi:Myb-like_DNA-binding domain-containing protein [Hexamita inflata]|uniref:Myb-like DNA-binding domain-containing protein n=1 Tax=Hexamita inflata TaxID=28002 RepID=A0AA86QSS5_9EUKA|nr:Myb-like DNA-binding domain-containing protein [Hexamita inflata]